MGSYIDLALLYSIYAHVPCQTLFIFKQYQILSHITTSPPHKLILIAARCSERQPLLHSTLAQRGCCSSLPPRTSQRGLYLALAPSLSTAPITMTLAPPTAHCRALSPHQQTQCSVASGSQPLTDEQMELQSEHFFHFSIMLSN